MIREARKQNTGLKAHGVGLQSLTRMFGVSPLSAAAVWMTNGKITYWSHHLADLLWISGDQKLLEETIKLIFDYPSLRRRVNVALQKYIASKSSYPFPLPVKINGIWSIVAVTFKHVGELFMAELKEWPEMQPVPVAKPAAILMIQYDIQEDEIHWFEMSLPNGVGSSGICSAEEWIHKTESNHIEIYRNHFDRKHIKPGIGFLQHQILSPVGFNFFVWEAFTNVVLSKNVHHVVSTAIAYASPAKISLSKPIF